MSDAPHKFDLHIGDYLRDTEDLSLLQHGAYLRLMLWYYSTAKPLPNDLERVYRRVGATSREEKHAVEHVLTEFFRLTNGKWVHKRIEEELAKWNMATQTARNNAQSRWEKFRVNNNNADADAMQPQCDGNANPDASRQPVAVSLPPVAVNPPEPARKTRAAPADGKGRAVWEAYSAAYMNRYGVEPVRNATVNAKLAQLVDKLGAVEAPHVAAFYVRHDRQQYVVSKHGVSLLLRDAEGLRTDWATRHQTTEQEARQADKTASQGQTWHTLMEEAKNAKPKP